jgi:hypothetical protein
MKKVIILIAIVVLSNGFNSCASKSKGCGLTADNENIPTQQEIVVAQASE